MKAIVTLARCLLGLVLLAAGLLKGMSPEGSVVAVGAFHLTPLWLTLLAGVVLPGIELVTALALLGNVFTRGAALIAFGLSCVFTVGIASAMVRRIDLDCGCFGHLAIAPRAGWTTLGVDLTLAALSLLVLFGARRSATPH